MSVGLLGDSVSLTFALVVVCTDGGEEEGRLDLQFLHVRLHRPHHHRKTIIHNELVQCFLVLSCQTCPEHNHDITCTICHVKISCLCEKSWHSLPFSIHHVWYNKLSIDSFFVIIPVILVTMYEANYCSNRLRIKGKYQKSIEILEPSIHETAYSAFVLTVWCGSVSSMWRSVGRKAACRTAVWQYGLFCTMVAITSRHCQRTSASLFSKHSGNIANPPILWKSRNHIYFCVT